MLARYSSAEPGGPKAVIFTLGPHGCSESGMDTDAVLSGGVISTDAASEQPAPLTGTSAIDSRNCAVPFGANVTTVGAGPICCAVIGSRVPAPAPPAPDVPKKATSG